MAKSNLSEQLNAAVEAILAKPGAALPRSKPSLAALVRVAAKLRGLPRDGFKARLKTDLQRRAAMASQPVPVPEMQESATPYLSVGDAAGAIEFYKKAFGATEVMRLVDPSGKIVHAEIQVGRATIMLAEEFPELGFRSPQALGGSAVMINLLVADADAVVRQAVAAGARVERPLKDEFYGERTGTIVDPFGHRWIVATRTEDVPAEEIVRRFEALTKQGAAAAKPEARKTAKAVREGRELIEFVKQAFGAEGQIYGIGSEGGFHAEYRIGDSMVMIGGGAAWRGTPLRGELHLYVTDADAVYQQALEAGATSLYAPTDQPYGDREAGVKDVAGNYWYIATHKATGHMPEGLRSVTPCLHPHGAPRLLEFLKQGFGAEELVCEESPEGTIVHAKMRIGDSVVELGEAHGQFQPMPAMFYLYVDEVQAWYERALRAGATSHQVPTDRPYGAREAGVRDFAGNLWYLATQIRGAQT
jgi:PhnB protein